MNIKRMNFALIIGTAALSIFFSSVAAYAQQWEMALRNPGGSGSGYYKAYSSVSACKADQDEGDSCIVVFEECGSNGVKVVANSRAVDNITDTAFGDLVRVLSMDGDDVSDSICAGYIR